MLEQSNPPKVKSIYDIETDNDFEKNDYYLMLYLLMNLNLVSTTLVHWTR